MDKGTLTSEEAAQQAVEKEEHHQLLLAEQILQSQIKRVQDKKKEKEERIEYYRLLAIQRATRQHVAQMILDHDEEEKQHPVIQTFPLPPHKEEQDLKPVVVTKKMVDEIIKGSEHQ
jgi:5,10-methylene-tetrahydrofolate dehydrogenase/methenyl tetrahydrofolate cyclohydrolase